MHEANAMHEQHLGSTLNGCLAEDGWIAESEPLAAERTQ
jgi:hypothetical protein